MKRFLRSRWLVAFVAATVTGTIVPINGTRSVPPPGQVGP